MKACFGQKYYGRLNTFHYRCHFNLKLYVIKKLLVFSVFTSTSVMISPIRSCQLVLLKIKLPTLEDLQDVLSSYSFANQASVHCGIIFRHKVLMLNFMKWT